MSGREVVPEDLGRAAQLAVVVRRDGDLEADRVARGVVDDIALVGDLGLGQ
jgi:hypothetical protein